VGYSISNLASLVVFFGNIRINSIPFLSDKFLDLAKSSGQDIGLGEPFELPDGNLVSNGRVQYQLRSLGTSYLG
jgi:hypothetical protein